MGVSAFNIYRGVNLTQPRSRIELVAPLFMSAVEIGKIGKLFWALTVSAVAREHGSQCKLKTPHEDPHYQH
jgi:hypothetical protein